MRWAHCVWAFALLLASCLGGNNIGGTDNGPPGPTCTGHADFGCAKSCGSDAVAATCLQEVWTCPPEMVKSSDCPPGTCFGYSLCCGPNGEHSSKICPVGGTPSPSAGHCPDGYDDCAVSECAKNDTCAFCCDKYFSAEASEFGATLQTCVCASAGPCAAACSDDGFCTDPKFGPSSTCEACLLAQREANAPCAASVSSCNASASCKPYLDCLTSCGP